MAAAETFLVIDDNTDSRFLLVKTLLRKFPGATVHECHSVEKAMELAERCAVSAIVTHRTTEMSGLSVVRQLRAAHPAVPMVMVSSIDRRDAALQAGATAFLLYDEWLRIGTLVSQLLAPPKPDPKTDVDDDTPRAEPAGTT